MNSNSSDTSEAGFDMVTGLVLSIEGLLILRQLLSIQLTTPDWRGNFRNFRNTADALHKFAKTVPCMAQVSYAPYGNLS
jgi:hypothetical protein